MQTTRRRSVRDAGPQIDSVLHIAVVVVVDGVLFTAVEGSKKALRARLGKFVRVNASAKLWPPDSAEVLQCLDRGDVNRGVALYFERVGDRWDREFLHVQVVDSSIPD